MFSLGQSMWMLLRQPAMEFDEVEHPNDLVTDWDRAEDILEPWREMIDRCMVRDPNERPDVVQVVRFWEAQAQEHAWLW